MRTAWWSLVVLMAAPVGAPAQTLAGEVSGCQDRAPERTIAATPSNYRTLLTSLQPGDRLLLAAGTYTQGLPITNLHGQAGRCIVIEGPDTGSRAVFNGRSCCNTVSLSDSSYVAVRNLELDGLGLAVDAVKAESPSASVHHVLLENLDIHGHGASQPIVGISTKCPAWNWAIRRNVITGAGTGLYLGNSDGSAEFVNGLVEHNLVRDTIGYNMQIKHQNVRNTGLGEPASGRTVIRHNVFSKASNASSGEDARPNVLLGHWPVSGNGSNDVYEVYGNVFHQNPAEALFQAEGNVALYANVFVSDADPGYPAVAIQPHNDVPRAVDVFHNTVVVPGRGIDVSGGAAGTTQRVRGNAVFAATPLDGGTLSDNVAAAYGSAPSVLSAPFSALGGGLDLYPLAGQLQGSALDTAGLSFRDAGLDFDGTPYDQTFRGAYAGSGTNPGWALALARKPSSGEDGGGDPEPDPVFVSIADATAIEANDVKRPMRFALTLSRVSDAPVTVAWSTGFTGTATSGRDYVAASGVTTFAVGVVTRLVTVQVRPDLLDEAVETLHVNLGTVTNAELSNSQGEGSIQDNDPLPSLAVKDLALTEGSSGTKIARVPVRLSRASGRVVRATWSTGSTGTATLGSDYLSAGGELVFAPGETVKYAEVTIVGDTVREGAETFFVTLGGPVNATIVDAIGRITISNDDL